MPDFDDIKQEAESHSKDVDEGIDKVEQIADKEAGGKDKGLIDKAGAAADKAIGDQQSGSSQ